MKNDTVHETHDLVIRVIHIQMYDDTKRRIILVRDSVAVVRVVFAGATQKNWHIQMPWWYQVLHTTYIYDIYIYDTSGERERERVLLRRS